MTETQARGRDALGARAERSYLQPDVEIRVLGPLEVLNNGVDVRLGGRKQRTVLALLAAEVGKPNHAHAGESRTRQHCHPTLDAAVDTSYEDCQGADAALPSPGLSEII